VIYRIVPAALLVALAASAVATARAGSHTGACTVQRIERTLTHAVVGGGRLCTSSSTLSLNARVTLPRGAFTVYFSSGSSLRTLHVQGGTTVFLYDHAPLALTDRVFVVKGAKGCGVRAHALVPGCPVWAASVGA
jgi:hypothetical protein